MSAKEMNTEAQTTPPHWGYRELDTSELQFVGGGDDGDGDSSAGCDAGGGYSGDCDGGGYGSGIADSGVSYNNMEGASSGGFSDPGLGFASSNMCMASEFAGPSTAAQTAEANTSGPGSWGNTASWGIGAIVGANLAFGNAPGAVAAGAYGLFGALTQDRPGGAGTPPANLSDISAP
jgi:hypothetical protein